MPPAIAATTITATQISPQFIPFLGVLTPPSTIPPTGVSTGCTGSTAGAEFKDSGVAAGSATG